MDTKTGKLYQLDENQSLEDLADKISKLEHRIVVSKDLVELAHLPDAECPKCHGRGSVPKGLFSRRYKPCKCTSPS